MLGVSNPPRTGSLTVRKFAGGRRAVEGVVPEAHTFPAKFLERELNDAVRVRIVVPVVDGEYVYEAASYQRGDFEARLVSVPGPPRKRRWFRRK